MKERLKELRDRISDAWDRAPHEESAAVDALGNLGDLLDILIEAEEEE